MFFINFTLPRDPRAKWMKILLCVAMFGVLFGVTGGVLLNVYKVPAELSRRAAAFSAEALARLSAPAPPLPTDLTYTLRRGELAVALRFAPNALRCPSFDEPHWALVPRVAEIARRARAQGCGILEAPADLAALDAGSRCARETRTLTADVRLERPGAADALALALHTSALAEPSGIRRECPLGYVKTGERCLLCASADIVAFSFAENGSVTSAWSHLSPDAREGGQQKIDSLRPLAIPEGSVWLPVLEAHLFLGKYYKDTDKEFKISLASTVLGGGLVVASVVAYIVVLVIYKRKAPEEGHACLIPAPDGQLCDDPESASPVGPNV